MESQNNQLFDLHCHVLPGMDDGCRSSEESVELLRQSQKQGITGVIATPHYYPEETVEKFLSRRLIAYERLEHQLAQEADVMLPICLGAEVAYHTGLIYEKQIEKLCLGNSRYLLLELPFYKWSAEVLREVRAFRSVHGIIPVIAHLERYFKIQSQKMLEEIYDSDVLIQMNAEYILRGFWSWRNARKLLINEKVHVIGSDSHNLIKRPPNLGFAAEKLEKQGMKEELHSICRRSSRIFNEAQGGN